MNSEPGHERSCGSMIRITRHRILTLLQCSSLRKRDREQREAYGKRNESRAISEIEISIIRREGRRKRKDVAGSNNDNESL